MNLSKWGVQFMEWPSPDTNAASAEALEKKAARKRRIILGVATGALLIAVAAVFIVRVVLRPARQNSYMLEGDGEPGNILQPAIVYSGSALDYEGEFAAGRGTAGNPYIICTAQQLDNVRLYLDAYFLLHNDIDLSTFHAFTPIGTAAFRDGVWDTSEGFSGMFDGNFYTISGLDVVSSTLGSGLFGAIDARGIVKNLYFEGTVTPALDNKNNAVGGIAGYNGGTISNCQAQVTVDGAGTYAMCGGIAGANKGTINHCSTLGKIGATGEFAKAGGVVGLNLPESVLEACTNGADVRSSYSAGGIASWNEGRLSNCINAGGITGRYAAGGIAAHTDAPVAECKNTGKLTAQHVYDLAPEEY